MGISIIVPIKPPEPYYPTLKAELQHTFQSEQYEILEQYEKGLVNAVVQGIKRSRYEYIAVLDADGSHRPIDLHSMYQHITKNNYDLVVGSKVLGNDQGQLYRRAISVFYRLIAQTTLNIKVTDPMSGMVVCKRKYMEKIKPTQEYKYLLQLLLYTHNVVEYPIVFENRKSGKSKVSLQVSVTIFLNLLKLRRNRTIT